MLEESRSPLSWQARAALWAVLGDLARPAWRLCKRSFGQLQSQLQPAGGQGGALAAHSLNPGLDAPCPGYLRGGVHGAVRSAPVTLGLGALIHLADSILFSLPSPLPASLPALPAGPPPPYSACSLAIPACPISINTRSLSLGA